MTENRGMQEQWVFLSSAFDLQVRFKGFGVYFYEAPVRQVSSLSLRVGDSDASIHPGPHRDEGLTK
jgi:hypothetical protein